MNIEYYVLDNGLRLLISRFESPTVGIAVGVGIGSIYEDRDLRGISHFAEHIIYRAYPNIDLEIEGLGGVSDAYTERTLTMYLFEVIPSELRNLLRLIYKMFSNRRVDNEDFERERRVILSEIKMRNDDPGTLIYDLGPRALFGDSDYGAPIIGTEESISSMATKDLENFLESYYTPDNMVVSIVGPINMPINEIIGLFNGWDGKSSRKKIPTMGKGGPIVIRRPIESAYLSYSWQYNVINEDSFLLSIKSSLLEFHLVNGLSSYLMSRFRNKGLTYTIDMDRDYLPGTYYYQLVVSAVNEESIDIVKEELVNALLSINDLFKDEYYLSKRLNYLKYLISDYLRRPIQVAESMSYMELKLSNHDIDEFNNGLERHFRDSLDHLITNGVWSEILPL
ncbi:M16 family metallopeptidase [Vulcanisaeta sp. JCM 14467]|uniref:M16 family metallopeptidase n=1 Tax=Vulcanisaeta sp. JCM 14467 TaxID=1295370 RepID=UPI0006CF9D0F|nr:pitrilysin family protein [Vulcanisaeta sp. JCM 14467]